MKIFKGAFEKAAKKLKEQMDRQDTYKRSLDLMNQPSKTTVATPANVPERSNSASSAPIKATAIEINPRMMEEEEDAMKRLSPASTMKKGGRVKASSASKRADGCAKKGKTRGRMV
jgi:uncharacterized protein (DUF169 family)